LFGFADADPDQPSAVRKPTAPSVVNAFKAYSTLLAQKEGLLQRGESIWQDDYYDHVVRNDNAFMRIQEYIYNNPLQWHLDRENESRTGENDFYKWLEDEAAAQSHSFAAEV